MCINIVNNVGKGIERYYTCSSIDQNDKNKFLLKRIAQSATTGALIGGSIGGTAVHLSGGTSVGVGVLIGSLIGGTGGLVTAIILVKKMEKDPNKVIKSRHAKANIKSVKNKLVQQDNSRQSVCPISNKVALDPVEHPYSPKIFNRKHLVDHVNKHGKCPVSGHPLDTSEIRISVSAMGNVKKISQNVLNDDSVSEDEKKIAKDIIEITDQKAQSVFEHDTYILIGLMKEGKETIHSVADKMKSFSLTYSQNII